jgi:hypothetical protein
LSVKLVGAQEVGPVPHAGPVPLAKGADAPRWIPRFRPQKSCTKTQYGNQNAILVYIAHILQLQHPPNVGTARARGRVSYCTPRQGAGFLPDRTLFPV